jgi:hypothetical protein
MSPSGDLPPQLFSHSMAYDAGIAATVLFGGRSPTATLSSTWKLDGDVLWLNPTTPQPTARNFAAMAWDETRQRVVLFGGNPLESEPTASDGHLADTWEYVPFSIACT